MYLHLLSRLEHSEGCTERRCVRSCDVAAFLSSLEQPLLLVDVEQQDLDRRRLAALAKGEIPEAV